MLPSRFAAPVFAAQPPTFDSLPGFSYEVEWTLHTSWNAGYIARATIHNTGSEDIFGWVLHANRPLNVTHIDGGRIAHADPSETVIDALHWNTHIPPGGSVYMTIQGRTVNGQVPTPTEFRLSQSVRIRVPSEYYTTRVAGYNAWAPFNFHLGIYVTNVSDWLIQGWEVAFDLTPGAYVQYVPTAQIIQVTSGSAIAAYIPGSHIAWHPRSGPYHLSVMGYSVGGVIPTVSNIEIFQRVAVPLGIWPDWIPGPPQNGNGDDNGDDNGNGNGGDDDDEPVPTPTPDRTVRHGIEFEQQFAYHLTDLIPPSIDYVDVEVLDFIRGIYRVTLSTDNCTLDPRAEPFFFWGSPDGIIDDVVEYGPDAVSFTFSANPGTGGREVYLLVGVGDNLGQVARLAVVLKGNDDWTWPIEPMAIHAAHAEAMVEPFMINPLFSDILGMPTMAQGGVFTDVPLHHWAHMAIRHLTTYGAITGLDDGSFQPNEEISLQHFLTMVLRISGRVVPGGGGGDSMPYFEFAYIHGLIDSGRSATESIRRYEAYSLLYSILTHPNSTVWNRMRNTAPRTTAPMPFGDADDIPSFHRAMLQRLFEHGIISGESSGNLYPRGNITRAQMARALFRAVTPPYSADADGIDRVYPNLTRLFAELRVDEPRSPETLNSLGAYIFVFTAPSAGIFTFTATNNFAALVYSKQNIGHMGELDERFAFTPMHFMPQRPDGQPASTQVRHTLYAGQTVVVAVSGRAWQNFNITVTKEVRYVRPVRVAIEPIIGQVTFGWPRSGGTRAHAGVDFAPLAAYRGSSGNRPNVYAVADGVVVRYAPFYRGTNALEIVKDDGRIVRYTEINRIADLNVGDRVYQGQVIAFIVPMIGLTRTMLHLEYYYGYDPAGNPVTGSLTQNNPNNYYYVPVRNYQRRRDLLDPTFFTELP